MNSMDATVEMEKKKKNNNKIKLIWHLKSNLKTLYLHLFPSTLCKYKQYVIGSITLTFGYFKRNHCLHNCRASGKP